MRTWRRRRWRRLAALRARRLAGRHYLSLLSAAVLGVALAVGLTDGRLGSIADEQPGADASADVDAAAAPRAVARQASRPQTGWVVYYLVKSARQVDEIGAVFRDEAAYRDEGAALRVPTAVYFLVFDTPQQEVAGALLLNQVAELAPLEGFNLKIVDLTQ